MRRAHFILYVADQARSTSFYRTVFGRDATLDVPGMTEFALNDGAVLGLMPAAGATRLLGIECSAASDAPPRAEIYLLVDDPHDMHRRALAAGAREISAVAARDWGHIAGYSADPDGHIVAFATEGNESPRMST